MALSERKPKTTTITPFKDKRMEFDIMNFRTLNNGKYVFSKTKFAIFAFGLSCESFGL